MSLTYSLSLAVSSTTVAAGTPFTSSWIDLSSCYDATVSWQVTNGASGPTIAAQVQIEYANDYNGGSPTSITNGTFGGAIQTQTGNSVVTAIGGIQVPGGGAIRFIVSGNTGQSVSFQADVNKRTGI